MLNSAWSRSSQQWDAAEFGDLVLEPAGVVGDGEAGDPFGGGGERGPVPGLAGPDAQADGQVGLAGAGWAEEHHILFRGNEIQRAEMGDGVAPVRRPTILTMKRRPLMPPTAPHRA